MTPKAFTLIELLIVVAIIAILAAIAVPNFLEAQTRAKVSRVKNDFRTIKNGLEAYFVDHNGYPPHVPAAQYGDFEWFVHLTTPIAYISAVPHSPFPEENSNAAGQPRSEARRNYGYWPAGPRTAQRTRWYALTSVGPNHVFDFFDSDKNISIQYEQTMAPEFVNGLYDPSNGTKSQGDLVVTNTQIY